ncbi:hypothetical protein [Alkalihalobacterium sp. APHAB7]|uniref:hypothetical protein n=1 Tax=Alkalihalobacterium sp. APHAB7 TaxID=3402081 RepID=UPI003AAF6DAD
MPRGRKRQFEHLENEWLRLYNEEGMNFSQIAQKHGVQVETVSKYIKDKITVTNNFAYNEYLNDWIKNYQSGKRICDIAKSYKVSKTVVRRYIYNGIIPVINDLKWNWVSLYKKGHSLRGIGQIYNIHPKIVRNTIESEVAIPCINQRKTYDHLIENWIKSYEEGLSFESIAKKYDVSSNTVYKNICNRVEIRRKLTKTETIKQWVPIWQELYNDKGYTQQEIAQKYKVAVSTVSNNLR